jgi:cytochrome b involved in lipid metabolism/protoporphyrinogen oxidase
MSYDYIVVGGGIAGLNTCLKLVNGKNKILLLERNNRLGGRLHTYNKDGLTYEIGGARFHKGHKNLFELIKMFNLEKKIFPIPNDKTFIPIKNKFTKKYDLDKIIKTILDKADTFKKEELLKMNMVDLCNKILTKEECLYFQNGFEYICENEDLNAYEAVDTFRNDLNNDFQFYLFQNGFGELLENMGKFLKDNRCQIKLQQTLIDFKLKNGTYHLDVLSGSKNVSYKTDNLILALDKTPLLSLPYLKSFKPTLDSVKNITLVRIYAVYPKDPKTKKVWFHDIGKVTTDMEIKYIIPYNPNEGLIMISYTDQRLAEFWDKLANQGQEKLEQELIKQLKKLFPKKKIPKTTYLKAHTWYNGVHLWKKGFEALPLSTKIIQPFEKESLYICGEAYSQRQGWVEGALESSEEVLKRINDIKTNKKIHHISKKKGGGKKKKTKKKKTKKLKKYTREEVAKHNKPDDLWIIISKKVLDVTKWQHSHPGSPAPLLAFAGKDATSAFKNRGHSDNAKKIMKKFIIGKV